MNWRDGALFGGTGSRVVPVRQLCGVLRDPKTLSAPGEWLGRGDPRVAVAWDPWSVHLHLWKQMFMGLEELALGHPDFKGRGTPTPGHPSQPRDQQK